MVLNLTHVDRPTVRGCALLDGCVIVHESPRVDTAQAIARTEVLDDLVRLGFLLPVAGTKIFRGLDQEGVVVGFISFSNGCHESCSVKSHQTTGDRADVCSSLSRMLFRMSGSVSRPA